MFETRTTDAAQPAPRGRFHLPSLCAVCLSWGTGRICDVCTTRYATPVPRCRRCALPVPPTVQVCGACSLHPPAFDTALARVDYAYPWDRLVADFKFHAALDLAIPFAEAIVDARRRDDVVSSAVLILPVPLSEARLRERGYNQAWQVARRVARRIGADADARLLLRIRDTAHQLALPPEERAGNVRGAFAVEPRRSAELRGRAVAVVDDVMTTGCTLAEIARVLKAAGAASVAVWVVARTPRPGEG